LYSYWEPKPPTPGISNQYLFQFPAPPPNGVYLVSVRVIKYCRADALIAITQNSSTEDEAGNG
jgi:hypothetical protein